MDDQGLSLSDSKPDIWGCDEISHVHAHAQAWGEREVQTKNFGLLKPIGSKQLQKPLIIPQVTEHFASYMSPWPELSLVTHQKLILFF